MRILTPKAKAILVTALSLVAVLMVALGIMFFQNKNVVAEIDSIVFIADNNAKNQEVAIPTDGNNWYNTVVNTQDGYMSFKPKHMDNGYSTGIIVDSDDLSAFNVADYPIFKIRMKRDVGTFNAADFDTHKTWQGKPVFTISMEKTNGGSSSSIYWEISGVSVVNGKWVDIIIDLSRTQNSNDAVQYFVNGTSETGSFKFDYFNGQYNGTFSSLKITPFGYNQEEMYIEREITIEHFGFFKTTTDAQNYTVDKAGRVSQAKQALQGSQISMDYIEGKTEALAIKNAMNAISTIAGVGVNGENPTYVVSNDQAEGYVSFEKVKLASGGVIEELENITVTIEKPYAPVVWTYTNDSDLVGMQQWDLKTMEIKDNSLHIVKKTPKEEDGFDFTVDMAEGKQGTGKRESFQMEHYGYLKMMFKVVGQGRLQFYHFETREDANGNVISQTNSNSRSFVVGWEEDTWLSVIVDFSKTYGAVTVENMETGEIEVYDVYGDNYAKNFTPVPFEGLSQRFRFNFGRRHNLEREAYIKYIGFFPTMEQALAYDSGKVAFEIDAQMKMQNTVFSADFEDANTLERAITVAKEQIYANIGYDAEVVLNVAEYVEPQTDKVGKFDFSAQIKYKGSEFTFNGLTMPISAEREIPTEAWFFNNPEVLDLIKEDIGGKVKFNENSISFTSKILSGFKISDIENRFYVDNYKNICLGIKSVEAGELNVVIVTDQGEFKVPIAYEGSSFVKRYYGSLDGITGRVLSVGFECQSLEFSYVAFITGDSFDGRNEYSNALTEQIISLEKSYSVRYYQAKTADMAKEMLVKELSNVIGDDVLIDSIVVEQFVKPSSNENGKLVVTVTFTNESVLNKGFASSTFTVNSDKAVNNDVIYDFADSTTFDKVSGMWNSDDSQENFYYDAEKGEVVMSADNIDDTNGVGFIFLPKDSQNVAKELDIQEYKYIKFGFTRNGFGVNSANSTQKNYTGKAEIIFRRKGIDANHQHFEKDMMYISFELNSYDYRGVYLSALLDLEKGSISIFNPETNELLSTAPVEIDKTGSYDNFNGISNQVYVKMCRNVKKEGTNPFEKPSASVKYFGMFEDITRATEFKGEFYAKATMLDGNNCIKTEKTISNATTVDTLIKLNEQTLTEDGLILSYGNVKAFVNASGEIIVNYNDSQIINDNSENYLNGAFIHLALHQKDGKIQLYVNGVKKGEATGTLGSSVIHVGGFSARENNVRGFCVYLRAWKNADINDVLEYGFVTDITSTSGLIGGWRLSGDTFSQKGVVSGAGDVQIINVYGRQSHEFIGQDYLSTEKQVNVNVKTIETWIKISDKDLGKEMAVFSTDGTNKLALYILQDGKLKLSYGEKVATSSYSVAGKGWTLISFVIKSASVDLYVNGELAETLESIGDAISSVGKLNFGYDCVLDNNYMVGFIGETRFWTTERTASQILSSRDSYALGNEEGLARCYRFDCSKNLIYTDYSNSKADATINSDGWFRTNMVDYEHSMIILGDSQNHIVEDPTRNDIIVNWILENKESYNIEFVMHVGDFTQNCTDLEMSYAYGSISALNDILPFAVTMGNHDYPSLTNIGAEIRDSSMFNKYMDYDYYSQMSYFGGAFEVGKMENVYMFFETGDIEWMIFVVEFAPRDEVIEWADYVIAQYPNKNVIILTHQFMSMTRINDKGEEVGVTSNSSYLPEAEYKLSGEGMYLDVAKTGLASQAGETANEGLDLWTKLGKRHANIVQIVCGHSQADTQMRVEEGENGNVVNMIHHDASTTMKVGDWSHETMLAIMKFNEDGEACVYQYSAERDAFYKTSFYYSYTLDLQELKGE